MGKERYYADPCTFRMGCWCRRLDPKPDPGEQERVWRGLAHTGGRLSPMIAVQISTFQKGVGNLTELTPPPDAVLPRWKALSETIEVTLDQ